jgi:hypothetical protein
MPSAGRLSKLMPVKGDGGRIETVLIEQEGPIAFVESTTLSRVFDEDANRCLLLQTDEREDQTRRIVRRLAQAHAGNGLRDADRVRAVHHALQRMLSACGVVVVPFADRLAERFDCRRVQARRAFPQLLALIQASALLHNRQREADGTGRLAAGAADYHLARRLILGPLARSVGGGVSASPRRLLDRLTRWGRSEFTSKEAADRDAGSSKSSVYGWLAELHEAGALEQTAPSRGRCPARWRLTGHDPEPGDTLLPTVEDIFPGLVQGWNHGHNTQSVTQGGC